MARLVMGRLLCLLAVFLLVRCAESKTYGFGKDSRDLQVIGNVSGVVQSLNIIKQITIEVPPCMTINYVNVEARNHIREPDLKFTDKPKAVIITIKLLQSRSSAYTIMVKGRKIQRCDHRQMQKGCTARFFSTCYSATYNYNS